MADDRNFTLKIITPDRVFYEEQVSMVEFNTVEGEVGVYKDHIPMTMIIAPGILTTGHFQQNHPKKKGGKTPALILHFLSLFPNSFYSGYRTLQG